MKKQETTKAQAPAETKKVLHYRFEGVVENKSGDKTLRVRVDSLKRHPKYKKQYHTSKTYLVHDERNEGVVGATVRFEECRPLSKTKRWRLIK